MNHIWKLAIILPPIASVLFGYQVWAQAGQEGKLRITYFDIGQGDASLIQTPDHQNILIDAGPDRAVVSKLGRALDFGDRVIDIAIITHPQADHMGGMLDVLKRYHVNHIITSDLAYESNIWQSLVAYLHEKKIPVSFVSKPERIALGDAISLQFLWPDAGSTDLQTVRETNDGCVITELVFGATKFLSTCDASSEVETTLVQADVLEDIDVLKVGHHGSKTATSREFLEIVKPEASVIMVGRNNRYGHPHSQTLTALAQAGVAVYRTDEMGDISLISDGKAYALKFAR